jgi:hypothetical protein
MVSPTLSAFGPVIERGRVIEQARKRTKVGLKVVSSWVEVWTVNNLCFSLTVNHNRHGEISIPMKPIDYH